MGVPPADFHDPDQSSLTWLQGCYMSNCNGDWEHLYGVRIETLDNPGWTLRVELAGTLSTGGTSSGLSTSAMSTTGFRCGSMMVCSTSRAGR